MATAKPVISAADLDKTINTSTEALSKACGAANTAVTKKIAEAKKISTNISRLLKKKATLTKRSKAAVTRHKKSPIAANKKSMDTVAKELKLTQEALGNARAGKIVVLEELSTLRSTAKRVNAYTKAISAADKVLNKPVRKRRVIKKISK